MTVPLIFKLAEAGLPWSLDASVGATYVTATGEPRAVSTSFRLPLILIAKAVPPVKNSDFRLTISTDKDPVILFQLFADVVPAVLRDSSGVNPRILSLMFHNGADATILTSQNTGRYRIQSSTFEALWPAADELCRRLKSHFEPQGGVNVGYTEQMPLFEYFKLVDEHFECRKSIAGMSTQLETKATEFRAVQKRLLVRFKDRNPQPLHNLDNLLEQSYHQIISLGENVEKEQARLKEISGRLACGTKLIHLLLKCQFDLDEETFETIQDAWTAVVSDGTDQGWEDGVEPAITHMLRTSLAKSGKDNVTMPHQPGVVKDVDKLKKHMSLIYDRLSKGVRVTKASAGQ